MLGSQLGPTVARSRAVHYARAPLSQLGPNFKFGPAPPAMRCESGQATAAGYAKACRLRASVLLPRERSRLAAAAALGPLGARNGRALLIIYVTMVTHNAPNRFLSVAGAGAGELAATCAPLARRPTNSGASYELQPKKSVARPSAR